MFLAFRRGRPGTFFDPYLGFANSLEQLPKQITKRKERQIARSTYESWRIPQVRWKLHLVWSAIDFPAMHFTTLITQCLKPRQALKVSPEPSNYISYMQKALQIFLHVLFWSGSTLCALLHGTVLRWGIGKSSAWTLEWNRCISQDSKAFAAFVIQFIRDKETCCDYSAKGCEQGTVETGHVCQALIRTWKVSA